MKFKPFQSVQKQVGCTNQQLGLYGIIAHTWSVKIAAEMQIIHFSSPHFFIENQMVLGWKDGDGVPGGAANQQNAKVHRFSKQIY